MQSFEWVDATSVGHAAGLIANGSGMAKAGGLDLLDLMKEGIIAPARLVNLRTIPDLRGIRVLADGGLEIGALTTLAEIATSPEVLNRYTALAEASAHAATPQVRNAASLGGNLLQKPRCWYFRNQQFHEREYTDPAREGENQYHAIFDNASTTMVHASTPATALTAFDAQVQLVSAAGRTRTVAIREFFRPPTLHGERFTEIADGEILTHVILPSFSGRSAYHKQTERDSYDWPICDVAVCLSMQDALVERATVVMGWVAPTPRLVPDGLRGRPLTEETAREAARTAVAGATPLAKNAYKVPILEVVVRRTLLRAAEAGTWPK
jgi:xanthine dehydrogenase YagS FAD-binding subunit